MTSGLHRDLTHEIIRCCIEVHKELGPGLLESVYEESLCFELRQSNIQHRRQVAVPISYKGHLLESNLRIDVLVEEKVIVELKAVDVVLPVFSAQVLTYMKLAKVNVGLLVNFNVPVLKDGIERFSL